VEEAVEKEPRNAIILYDLLYDVRFQKNPLDLEGCIEVLNRAMEAPLNCEDRCCFATKKVQLIDNFPTSTADLTGVKEGARNKLSQELAERDAQIMATGMNSSISSTSDGPDKFT